MTPAFDIRDLKPECLHAVIKTTALLSDVGETMALSLPDGETCDLAVRLEQEYNLFKPQSGYDGSTAKKCAMSVDEWKVLLDQHPSQSEYVTAAKAMHGMLHQSLSLHPHVTVYKERAKIYRKVVLTECPKVRLRIYDHALLVHVPGLLEKGALIDGSSWFLL